MQIFIKYPKTEHISGSKECDVNLLPRKLQYAYPTIQSLAQEGSIIVEEKMDGMGIGIFYRNSVAYVQFRNHVFSQHDCPVQFKNIFVWLNKQDKLYSFLKENKILFGEWMEYKHCVFYDALPSYFIEYDIFDIEKEIFLDTPTRRTLLMSYNTTTYDKIISAHIVHKNSIKTISELVKLLSIKAGVGKTNNCATNFLGLYGSLEHAVNQSLYDIYPEGFYIKVEKEGAVIERYKFIRKSFLDKVTMSNHWEKSNPIKNKLIVPKY